MGTATDDEATVSICVISYNNARYVESCIKSVLAQTYRNIEIVFCDDASSDESREVFEAIVSSTSRPVRVVRVYHELNSGPEQNMLDGIAASTGAYVCNVDSDDMLRPEHVETLMRLIRRTGADIASTSHVDVANAHRYDEIDQSAVSIPWSDATVFDIDEVIPTLFLEPARIPFAYWHRLYRTELAQRAIAVPRGCFSNSDSAFSLAQFLEAQSLAFVDHPTYLYRVRNDSVSRRSWFEYFSNKTLGGLDRIVQWHRDYPGLNLRELNERRNSRAIALASNACIEEGHGYADLHRLLRTHRHLAKLKLTRNLVVVGAPRFLRPWLALSLRATAWPYFAYRKLAVRFRRLRPVSTAS